MDLLISKSLDWGARHLEYAIAGVTLVVASVMSLHLLLLCWNLVSHLDQDQAALPIKDIIIEAMNILIVLELMAIFVRLEHRHQVGITLLLDMAALFSIRETVLGLYSNSPEIWTAELSVALFVGLRVLYSGYKGYKSKHLETA